MGLLGLDMTYVKFGGTWQVRELLKEMFNPRNAKGILVASNHSPSWYVPVILTGILDSSKQYSVCKCLTLAHA